MQRKAEAAPPLDFIGADAAEGERALMAGAAGGGAAAYMAEPRAKLGKLPTRAFFTDVRFLEGVAQGMAVGVPFAAVGASGGAEAAGARPACL